MNRNDLFLAAAPVAVGLFGALACFATSQTAAEWVAAIGTIGAILAAIWVGQISVAEERARIAARARVTAFRLAPHIVTMLGDISRAREAMTLAINPPSMVYNNLMQIVTSMASIGTIPPEIFNETWTLPPHIALAVAQLESGITVHFRLVENIGGIVIGLTPEQKLPVLAGIGASLDALERLAIEIRNYCAAVSDAVVLKRRAEILSGPH